MRCAGHPYGQVDGPRDILNESLQSGGAFAWVEHFSGRAMYETAVPGGVCRRSYPAAAGRYPRHARDGGMRPTAGCRERANTGPILCSIIQAPPVTHRAHHPAAQTPPRCLTPRRPAVSADDTPRPQRALHGSPGRPQRTRAGSNSRMCREDHVPVTAVSAPSAAVPIPPARLGSAVAVAPDAGPAIGSLCTGYGGLDLAVLDVLGGHLAWVADNSRGAAAILAARFPGVPNLGDLTRVDWASAPPVDVVTAGFPCQDISCAGRRAGIEKGTRSGVWLHITQALGLL